MSESTDTEMNDTEISSSVPSINKTREKIEFLPGSMLEARDFNNQWFPAKVVEVDWDEREVLVHFQNWSSRYDEWISMDSARLRAVEPGNDQVKGGRSKDFKVGEKVMAVWNNNKRYPAKITKVLENGTYEVIFYDGFVMEVKQKQMSRMPKEQAEKLEIPFNHTTDEVIAKQFSHVEGLGSKEERRKRKKKIEVSTLFKYYKRRGPGEVMKSTSPQIKENEGPGMDLLPITSDKKRERPTSKDKSEFVKLNDTKLPSGWEKRAKMKTSGTKMGKWDVVIVGPEGRTFRSRQDIRMYIQQHQLSYDLELFDFRLGEEFYRERGMEPPKRAKDDYVAPGMSKNIIKSEPTTVSASDVEAPTFVPDQDGYRCPLENCRKLFRRDNLLLMHIKHYHPALLKKLGCKTLRVEDLAQARTAFESDDIKPSIYTQSILSALLTPPPQSTAPQIKAKVPGSEEIKNEDLLDNTISEELESIPLAKRVSLNETLTVNRVTGPQRPCRRKGEKRGIAEEVDDINDSVMGEGDNEMKQPGDEATESPFHQSVLDDVPGQKELVHCFCGSPEEDGLMIQCELCLCWQHGICLGIEKEEAVPDPYVCHFCRYPYRERLSQRYTHDQTWLKKGNLPSLKFISGNSIVPADKTLKVAHMLTAAATDLKQFLHSLKVKIDIAANKYHPKLYLWAQPWSKKSDVEVSNADVSSSSHAEDFKDLMPNIPLPEAPINATDCRLNLLSHIAEMQSEVESRLDSLETLFVECESEDVDLETPHIAKTLQVLLKDIAVLKRMVTFTCSL